MQFSEIESALRGQRVLVVEPRRMLADLVASVLEEAGAIAKVACTLSGTAAHKDIALVVLGLDPSMSPCQVKDQVRMASRHGARVVVFVDSDVRQARRALAAGASGVFSMYGPLADLAELVARALSDAPVVDSQLVKAMLRDEESLALTRTGSKLSARELEILGLIAEGASNQEVANTLHLAHSTVRCATTRIYAKLGVEDRAHAVATAMRRHLID